MPFSDPSDAPDSSPEQIYPHLFSLNGPSYLLETWRRLRAVGIPEQNVRYLPEVGHFTDPEVVAETLSEDPEPDAPNLTARHPHGPLYDPAKHRLELHGGDPAAFYPRLKVNIRAERVMLFSPDDPDAPPCEKLKGRLAHFMLPLMADLPRNLEESATFLSHQERFTDWLLADARGENRPVDGDELDLVSESRDSLPGEKSLARMTRQVCARYPELTESLPPPVQEALTRVVESLDEALLATDETAQRRLFQRTAQRLAPNDPLANCRAGFLRLAESLSAPPDDMPRRSDVSRFREWADILFLTDAGARADGMARLWSTMGAEEGQKQAEIVREFLVLLSYEKSSEKERIVREILEIFTTQVFLSVAALDSLWGIAWAHGALSDFRLEPTPPRHDGLFMGCTGGPNHRALLALLMRDWADHGGFMGIERTGISGFGATPDPPFSERSMTPSLAPELFDEGEWNELWAMAAWRRETADPITLLEVAAKRLIHPEVCVRLNRYVRASSGFGTLFSQPGATMAPGGRTRMLYPGAEVWVPLAEDSDEAAKRAKKRLKALIRLFLPACFRVEIVWQEALARLDRPSYLQHEFQQCLRLGDPWERAPEKEETPDPIIL